MTAQVSQSFPENIVLWMMDKAAAEENFLPSIIALSNYDMIEKKYEPELNSKRLVGVERRMEIASLIWRELMNLTYSTHQQTRDFAEKLTSHFIEKYGEERIAYNNAQPIDK